MNLFIVVSCCISYNLVILLKYCLFCGRRRVAVARYWMICLVLVSIFFLLTYIFYPMYDPIQHQQTSVFSYTYPCHTSNFVLMQ